MMVKLLGGFSIVALIMLTIGIVNILGVQELNSYVSEIGEIRLPSIKNLLIISESQTAIDSAENALLAKNLDLAGREDQYQRFDDVYKRAEEAWAIYEPLPQTIEEAEIWTDFVKAWDNWNSDHDKYVTISREYDKNRSEENYVLLSDQALIKNAVSFKKAEDLLNQIIEINDTISIESVLSANSAGQRITMVSIIGLVIGIILSFLIGILITLSIIRPLAKGVEFANALSVGDLNADLDVVQKDELGLLAEALRNMRDKLAEIVGSVSTGSEQIASASEQLASGNQDLSNRTEQQASALEETSSAIEEMNSSIKSNADNTQTADQLSREAVTKTEEGSETINRMVSSMDEINISSTRIADIIEVITNIAFQTNLLALNASIEAARAGEQGKGFAVVAVEVRKLAKRSDKAANEITAIIKTSNQKVTEGVDIANNAGVVLNEINGAVNKVTALVGEISAASQEQLSSAEEIDKTLNSLDENTQKNAALVEEAASATEELSAQAQELNTTMQFFKLDATKAVKEKGKTEKNTVKAIPYTKDTPVDSPKTNGTYDNFSEMVDEGEFDEF